MALTCTDICKFILAIILPPLGVLAEKGCGVDLLINIGLTLLGKQLDWLDHGLNGII